MIDSNTKSDRIHNVLRMMFGEITPMVVMEYDEWLTYAATTMEDMFPEDKWKVKWVIVGRGDADQRRMHRLAYNMQGENGSTRQFTYGNYHVLFIVNELARHKKF